MKYQSHNKQQGQNSPQYPPPGPVFGDLSNLLSLNQQKRRPGPAQPQIETDNRLSVSSSTSTSDSGDQEEVRRPGGSQVSSQSSQSSYPPTQSNDRTPPRPARPARPPLRVEEEYKEYDYDDYFDSLGNKDTGTSQQPTNAGRPTGTAPPTQYPQYQYAPSYPYPSYPRYPSYPGYPYPPPPYPPAPAPASSCYLSRTLAVASCRVLFAVEDASPHVNGYLVLSRHVERLLRSLYDPCTSAFRIPSQHFHKISKENI